MLSLRALSKSRVLPSRLIHTTVSRAYAPQHVQQQEQSRPRVSPTAYNARIMAASNKGHFSESLEVAIAMKDAGIIPDATTYNALLNTAARDGNWLFAWAIFDDMLLSGVEPSASTFAHLIHAQRDRPYSNLWNAIDKMNEFGIQANPPIYTAILNCLVKTGNIETALKYIFEMKGLKIIPELAAAQGVVILAAECGYSRLAIEIASYFEHYSSRSLPDHVWVACLASAAKNLSYDGVHICWPHVVNTLNVIPNEFVCMAVLNTAARHGHADLATDVLRVLRLGGVSWEEYHFTALIEAWCTAGQIKEALITLHLMRHNGIEPTESSGQPIFDSIKSDVDKLDAAWTCIDEIYNSPTETLDIDALKVVIRASIFLGDLQRAVGIYKSYDEYGISRDLTTFNLLLDGCIGANHRQLGGLILEDMKEAKIKPNQETYDKTIRLCLTQDTYEDAFYYLEEMKAAAHIPPRETYEAILAKCLSAEDPRSTLVIQEMEECGYKPQDSRQKTAATAIRVNKKRKVERK